ncbi:hypothetical protein ACHHYP_07024 [Achlya hypogyna]|uniref:Uncharacterized protein n=1 Tax=Achlya hypogyna TaxID=1202772 RepID=A0A1V9YR50_ACHHY|nr:hypothetical protein ACHHYP_07024 [Achlya hypogyna]
MSVVAVLQSLDLLRAITQYQGGVPSPLRRPLAHLKEVLAKIRYRCASGTSLWLGIPKDHKSWLDTYGLRALMRIAQYCPSAITEDVMDYMAGLGHLDAVVFLTEAGFACTQYAMNVAAEYGHLEIVRYLHVARTEGCTKHAMDYAAKNGHLDVVAFLHANRNEGCSLYAMAAAASNGHMTTVQFLHAYRTEGCTSSAMDLAAGNGDLSMVQFLHFNRHEGCTHAALESAAKTGHLGTVTFLDTNRTEGSRRQALLFAARFGHLPVVQYLLRKTSCGPDVLDNAARNNQLDVVALLLDLGYKGSQKAFVWAAMAGHLDMAKLLWAHCSELCNATQALSMAVEYKQTEMVAWLHTRIHTRRWRATRANETTFKMDHIEFILTQVRAPVY